MRLFTVALKILASKFNLYFIAMLFFIVVISTNFRSDWVF